MTADQVTVDRLELPPYLYDGYQVHRAALAHGLTVLSLPRQVLLAGVSSAVPSAISFTHGVPEASTVVAVTYAQDRRLRRALVERAGLPVPRGATFTFRSADKAASWAAERGFPVVVKETVGENPARAIAGVDSPEALRSAFQVLRKRDAKDRAPGSNPEIAGYATTRLGFEVDDEGNQVAPLKTRFLVEKQHSGPQIRVFACGDRPPVAVVLDVEQGVGARDVSAEIHPSLHDVAVRAVAAVPGLAVGSVDIILEDHRVPVDEQDFHVVEVAERIRSETYAAAASELGERIGDALLEFQATEAGLDLPSTRSEIGAELRIEGLRSPSAVVEGFDAYASSSGLEGSLSVTDELEGFVTGSVNGSPGAVAMLCEALMSGLVFDDRASCIETRPSS